MNLIYARYNMYHNSIDITTFDGYILRIDCSKAEEELKTTAWTDHVLNAMAIDKIDVSATINSEKPEEWCSNCIISSNTGLSVSLNSTIKILPTTAHSSGY